MGFTHESNVLTAALNVKFEPNLLGTTFSASSQYVDCTFSVEVESLLKLYEKITQLLQKKQSFVVATIVSHKGSVPRRLAKMVITKKRQTYGSIGGDCVEGQVTQEAIHMLNQGTKGVLVRSYELIEEEFGGIGMSCGGKVDVPLEVIEPDPQIIIAGSGHIAETLTKLANMLGFEITIVDPIAMKDKFPEADHVYSDFAEAIIPHIDIPQNACIAIVTRHKDDLPTLKAALKTRADYVGLIGSKRRVLEAYRILLKEGFSEEQLRKVNAPVGLEIGAETSEEIAVSIMAEISQHQRIGLEKPVISKKVKPESVRAITAT